MPGELSFPLPWGPSPMVLSDPTSMGMSLGTAYQANDPTKAAVVMINLSSTSQNSLLDSSQASQKGELIIGSTAVSVTGATGSKVALHENTQGGVLVVGLTITQKLAQAISFLLPAGWFFGVRQTTGANLSIVTAYQQAVN